MPKLRLATRLTVFVSFFFTASLLSAAPTDLAKADRRIEREPAYENQPGYCLLVFGPQAAGKVWLVLDGETLFVDRNGNGDLTEAREKFEPQNRRDIENSSGGYHDWEYQIGDLEPAGSGAKHTRFEVNAYRIGDAPACYVVSLWVNDALRQYAGWAEIFERRREDARVIQFGAPVMCRPLRGGAVSRTKKSQEIHLCFGTPGVGERSFAFVGYEAVPEKLHPQLSIEWPTADGAPLRTEATLDHRC